MSSSVWDDPAIRSGGEFVSFEKVGDSVSGTISAIRAHRFDDGKVAPQILLTTDDGEEKTVTAGAIKLKAELAEMRPEAGDHIVISLKEEEKRAGGKTLRHWDVKLVRGGAAPAAPASVPAQATAAPTPDPAALAAALANLTPEQKASLGIPA